MDKQKVGFRMREKRKELKLTQVDFAKEANISTNYYASLEQGKNSPSLEVLQRIAKALDVSVLYLLNDRIDDMEDRVEKEASRLKDLFKSIPKNQLDVAEGLITQAARLRILLDDNWKDILEYGEYEKFKQSESQVPYDRKRPIVETYDSRDKTYQSIIKQLTDLLPHRKVDSKTKLLRR
ncbi:hypothetical protein MACH08_05250 [Oceanobacillus kimchii]|uniref:HTH cro/C1-type domain-containing protein n=3 Tax=Bacteria TaxID=2 RepID=A0ABQ5TF01_9BACI|nr:hypothetical protein MACH08_05250 [Oceanobacillus kimchii]